MARNEHDARRIVGFFESAASSALASGARFYICLSSRQYPNIRLNKCLKIITEHNNEIMTSRLVSMQSWNPVLEMSRAVNWRPR